MYLEKLEVQGFKSFANKNELIFPGMLDKTQRGITAIVGPNGSGKSNVADAIRWTLGEQSMKTLRGKKSEDVIFSGSDKKGQLGMAEVSMHLNNEDRKADIDYSQIVITRRIYRSGESEYLLNNSRVRLSDIQMLLAKANFGQKTYSVIGQGVVEGFLNSSLAERKEFFDEATGVKKYQIKRDDALNKLKSSHENLHQADMLLVEIEPRLKSLTRQVNKLQRRGELETELKEIQLNYYSKLWHEIYGKYTDYTQKFLEIEKIKLEKEKKMEGLMRELNQMEADSQGLHQLKELEQSLAIAQSKKESLSKQLARVEAQIEMKLEAKGKFDLSWLKSKKTEIENEAMKNNEEMTELERSIEPLKTKLQQLKQTKSEIDAKISELNRQLEEMGSEKQDSNFSELEKKLEISLNKLLAAEAENDLNKVKIILKEIREELSSLSEWAAKHSGKQQTEHYHLELIRQAGEKERVIMETNELSLDFSGRDSRLRLLSDKARSLSQELKNLDLKISQHTDSEEDTGALGQEQKSLKENFDKVNQEISRIREDLAKLNTLEGEKRNRLFTLQKSVQSLQVEINNLNNQLNELKVSSTRYETRLEDLETEIRSNYGSLKEVKEHQVDGVVDNELVLQKISSLKHQLDMIGGIDPEIEKEFVETKERFDFLSGQVNDLDGAIDSLEKVIKELDITIKERFDKEFNIIAKKFDEYFKILFNGGTAKIIKVMDEEKEEAEPQNGDKPSEEKKAADQSSGPDLKRIKYLQKHNATGLAGIEIQATPPGKKIRSISMLSGGERALTAIALICAIISANPSPFVVLDEVDAALDEANSERLAKILDDLSHKTQFIVITHNRASMRRANIIYGVTMGDDGISRLLSIKFDEAKEVVRS